MQSGTFMTLAQNPLDKAISPSLDTCTDTVGDIHVHGCMNIRTIMYMNNHVHIHAHPGWLLVFHSSLKNIPKPSHHIHDIVHVQCSAANRTQMQDYVHVLFMYLLYMYLIQRQPLCIVPVLIDLAHLVPHDLSHILRPHDIVHVHCTLYMSSNGK